MLRNVVCAALVACASVLAVGCASTASDASGASESEVVQSTSAYTSLRVEDCHQSGEAYEDVVYEERMCTGQGGWHFSTLLADDAFAGVGLTREGVWSTLDLREQLAERNLGAWTRFGDKAEWRGIGTAPGVVDPYALIVRTFAKDANGRETNHLAVARLDKERSRACLVDLVSGATPDHNAKARAIADASRTMPCPGPCGTLLAGETLDVGESLRACENGHSLVMQGDGNLVVYDGSGTATWSSGTHGTDGQTAIMQEDGNFVLYGRSGRALWATNTSSENGIDLHLLSDGSLAIIGPEGHVAWSSNPNGE